MSRDAPRFVHIAAGCIENERGEVLVCQRPAHKIYPGEWEFPGGKLEAGETAEAALRRELQEELGIALEACRPLIRLRHVYPEIAVDLDVWKVSAYRGTLRSNEHPQVAWVAPGDLPGWKLLDADRPIVNALRLPPLLVVSPGDADLAGCAQVAFRHAPALLRLRLPGLSEREYVAAARRVSPGVRDAGALLVVDRVPGLVEEGIADGFHAPAAVLAGLRGRPVPQGGWFGASCHDRSERQRAQDLGADYLLAGPVAPTASHPGAPALGWAGFAALARGAGMPVYAIGGLGPSDLRIAHEHGAQGVAGISAFWDRSLS